jgi:hypothetical protein
MRLSSLYFQGRNPQAIPRLGVLLWRREHSADPAHDGAELRIDTNDQVIGLD